MDCSPFLNWEEDEDETFPEKTVVLRSLVTTLKLQPTLDDSLEAKAVTFLESVELYDEESAETLLSSLSSPSDKSLTECVQSIVVLLSTSNQAITTASMKILQRLIQHCSETNTLTIVKADLIPQLINTLNMLSLPFAEAEDIHHSELEIEDPDEQQAIYEMVLKQVLAPSEQYLCRLCQNRCSMIDSELSERFLPLFAQLLEIVTTESRDSFR
ncbi:hypothetical protein BLNAU_6715 [Blattamonas nauphoetae]|uniref:Uncharacterized protein n=1 Tax=Blattamonas nauphoetae TaxID=2049346 RepID=A0ABQ9Y3A8_9EUKA|nr:hypothetical protein BLNAU_6715 [Blattamonas nauphoetae]